MRLGIRTVGGHLTLHLQDVGQTPAFQAVTEVGVRAVAGVGDQCGGPQADRGQLVEHISSASCHFAR
ncbi:hypothetical protein SAVIM40S_03154 [Streptomyces avidinii]|uniref:Uncharacterized protein n=1 Tax=Streptomyces avidinii TaxID=1895 RepID=A0ABS4LG08_STRAV|nr:hypothetical protein [Streptomyces avidinii]MBP2040966.1 hypothetical protein [Streptomyces avidinii]